MEGRLYFAWSETSTVSAQDLILWFLQAVGSQWGWLHYNQWVLSVHRQRDQISVRSEGGVLRLHGHPQNRNDRLPNLPHRNEQVNIHEQPAGRRG